MAPRNSYLLYVHVNQASMVETPGLATVLGMDRLFNVLVLQGALLAAGCDPPVDDPAGDEGAGGSTADMTSTSAGTDDGPMSASDGPAPAQSGSEGDGSAGTTQGTETAGTTGEEPGSTGSEPEGSSSTGEPLECSDPPGSAKDPCGCPCCWIMECINTEPCCSEWSECAAE